MASAKPIAVGTRGTIGALVRKEIEYFHKLDMDRHGSSRKLREEVSQFNKRSWPSFGFLTTSWNNRKKRQRKTTSGFFLPSLCSVRKISDTNTDTNSLSNGIPRFGYRALRDDMNYNWEL